MSRLYRKKTLLILFATIAALILCCLIPERGFAWAGGGDSFSDGGGGGGDFGGGGFSGWDSGGSTHPGYTIGELLHFLVRLIMIKPAIGIPITIILIFLFFRYAKYVNDQKNSRNLLGRIANASTAISMQTLEENLKKIKEKDIAFDIGKFLMTMEKGFLRIQEAWSNQNLEVVRPLLSSAVFERFRVQINEQKRDRWRNVMDKVSVISSSISSAESDEWFDSINVRFEAQGISYKVNADSGKIIEGSKSLMRHNEYWTFLRRHGAKTRESHNLWEGNCPSCGAQITFSQNTKCPYCGTIVNSAEHDWVLSKITQESVWAPQDYSKVAGVAEACKADSSFIPQVFESIAATVFWKIMEARRTGDINILKKYASSSFLSENVPVWDSENGRLIYDDVAIGASDLDKVEIQNGAILSFVRIIFSGVRCLIDINGKKIPIKNEVKHPETEIYVFSKNITGGAKINTGLSACNCPNCGAPETVSDKETCDYCGAVLTSGDERPVLTRIVPAHVYMSEKMRVKVSSNLANERQKRTAELEAGELLKLLGPQSIIAGLVFVAAADGKIEPAEREYLMKWAQKAELQEGLVDKWIESSKYLAKTPKIYIPSDPNEAAIWARALIRIGLADGEIDNKERYALRQFCGRLNIEVTDMDRLIENETKIYLSELNSRL